MRGLRAAAGAALAASLLLGSNAWAAPAQHLDPYLESYDGTVSFEAGGNSCVAYAGKEHEVREGSYRLMATGSGARSAELKVVGTVHGSYEITPTVEGAGPSYKGSYREHAVGWLTDPENDQFRVVQFHLIGRLTGSDGSSLQLRSTLKVTVRPDGTTVVYRQAESCG